LLLAATAVCVFAGRSGTDRRDSAAACAAAAVCGGLAIFNLALAVAGDILSAINK